MKFTVDTDLKVLTLLEPVSFKELNKIKSFIGEDASTWTVQAKETVRNIHHHNNHYPWWYYPYYGTSAVGSTLLTTTSATNIDNLNTSTFTAFRNEANTSQVFLNATEDELSTTTLNDILK